MLRPVIAVSDARRGAPGGHQGGGRSGGPRPSRRMVAGRNDEGQAAGPKGLGAELTRGPAGWTPGRRGHPGRRDGGLTARHAVVLCTGPARTGRPDRGAPLDQPARHLLPHRARTAAIVSGGGGGVEMASAWQGLGPAVALTAEDDDQLPGWSRSPGNWSAAPWPRPEWTSGSASSPRGPGRSRYR